MTSADRDAQPRRTGDEETSLDVGDVPAEIVAWVEKLHDVVDELAAAVAERSRDRLACRAGCSGCCADGLTVFVIEAARIARAHEALLAHEAPGPEGGCAFLDGEGRCRVYAERPYVCRTQGLPLRWIERVGPSAAHVAPGEPEGDESEGNAGDHAGDGDAFELVEARDICPLNEDGGPPLEALPAEALFTLGPFEERLAGMQARADGGVGRRVPLRALFRTPGPAVDANEKRSLPLSR